MRMADCHGRKRPYVVFMRYHGPDQGYTPIPQYKNKNKEIAPFRLDATSNHVLC